ncbi:MAG TPA: DNA-binding protein [Firmicutes bacterium]|jgi:Uma2 family endonuclease|nr:DNA-binding protein [Bacillota bacterium]HCX78304.1 DNA-binding protein [Bacillota bacterium]
MPPDKQFGSEDFWANIFDMEIIIEPGYRLELLEGKLVWDQPPSINHQRISHRLQRILEDYFREIDPKGEMFHAPLCILPGSCIQPDLLYISGEQRDMIRDTHIDGAPNLVAEIISPLTRIKDSLIKHRIYLKAGIQHFWLLDPENRILQCLSLGKDSYALVVLGTEDEAVEHPDFAGLSIDLRSLWNNGECPRY